MMSGRCPTSNRAGNLTDRELRFTRILRPQERVAPRSKRRPCLPHCPTSRRAANARRMSTPPDPSARANLSYAASGVDIDAGNQAVARMRRHVASTRRPEQLDAIGGFAGMFRVPAGFREPVLVSCADGVGSKLLVAIAMDRHSTVGIDLVAMNVNDLLVTGAEPLFLLDYIATHKVVPEQIEAIVEGICEGCRQSGASLLGGETAELPDLYTPGHYDLAATAVGVVEADAVWSPTRSRAGDVVLALPSSGLHSNGYSLARKALLSSEHAGLRLEDPLPGGKGETVGEALLVPTRIYAAAFSVLRKFGTGAVHGAAHITGGGLIENPPRCITQDLAFELDLRDVPMPAIARAIAAQGVGVHEMRRTFNCGIGMLVLVAQDAVTDVRSALEAAGEATQVVGQLVARASDDQAQVRFVE